jgi:hypothetical protein
VVLLPMATPVGTASRTQNAHLTAPACFARASASKPPTAKFGKLSGIAVDDEARITDFYTRLDRHGSPELLLPSSAVSYVDRTTVYLLLDKHQLESLRAAGQDAQQPPYAGPEATGTPLVAFLEPLVALLGHSCRCSHAAS